MPNSDAIKKIKDCEAEAKKIINKAREEAMEGVLWALQKKNEDNQRLIKKEISRTEEEHRQALTEAESLVEKKKKEAKKKASEIIKNADSKINQAVEIIFSRLN